MHTDSSLPMHTDSEGIPEMQQRELAAAESVGPIPENPDTSRSTRNILQWMSYLPRACVKTMINMGWDRNT
jgi:hypothetical protein